MLRTRVVQLATMEAPSGQKVPVLVHIRWDGIALMINCVEGPMINGNCVGRKGPIKESSAYMNLPPFYSEFMHLYSRWNLNNMREGTFQQEQYLRDKECVDIPFAAKLMLLKEARLEVDGGHTYGEDWLVEEVPPFVIDFFFSLPEHPEGLPKSWSRRWEK